MSVQLRNFRHFRRLVLLLTGTTSVSRPFHAAVSLAPSFPSMLHTTNQQNFPSHFKSPDNFDFLHKEKVVGRIASSFSRRSTISHQICWLCYDSENGDFCCTFISPTQWRNNENHQEQAVYRKISDSSQIRSIPLPLPNTAIHILQVFPIPMLKEKYIL